jgi:hypothetical protein
MKCHDRRTPRRLIGSKRHLNLFVGDGKPVSGLNANDTTQRGYTLGHQIYVWQPGVDVTPNGVLLYVGGLRLNITTLANLLVRADVVRAMELDINTDWVNFATYDPSSATTPATAANGSDLLSDIVGTPAHCFETWWPRDFFTMSARRGTSGR